MWILYRGQYVDWTGTPEGFAASSLPGKGAVIQSPPVPVITAADITAADVAQRNRIDAAAGEARRKLVSVGYLVDQEYLLAYGDAIDYQAAGYSGTVPPGVQTWATAKGWTPATAAADILSTRALWKAESDRIRGARLSGKESVKSATTIEAKIAAADATIISINGG